MCLSLMKKRSIKRTTSDAKRLRLGKGIIVMKNINFKVILGLIVTTLLLSACGKGGGLYDDSGQTYRVATSSDINTLDSTLATDTVSFTIYNQVYEGLYSLNGKDEAVPALLKENLKIKW